MTNSPCDWSRLPDDPLGFFGLKPGFDRKDLKRAYGRLIRQYRPETHPRQFQQIRQAYEQLESQNRYGVLQQTAQTQRSAWEAAKASKTSERSPPPDRPAAQQRRSITDLAIDNPAQTFGRLKRSDSKTPQDFFVLAVLADLLEKGDHRFLRHLLDGLAQHPRDPGLAQLIVEYMRGDVPTKLAPKILLATAKACRSAAFYRMTEPLWERLLREASFEVFHQTLQKCEQQLRQTDPKPRVIFYLRLLKLAIWKAPDHWIDDVLGKLNRNGADLDESSEADLEFISLVRGYQQEDQPRIGRSASRRRIDRMIQDYCLGDWYAAASTVTQVLDEVARDGHGMMAAFPIVKGVDEHRLVMICMMIAGDVASQTGADFEAVDEAKSTRQAISALNDLRDSLNPIGNRIAWLERRYLFGGFILLVLSPPFLFMGILPAGDWAALALMWVVGTTAAYFAALKPKVLAPKIEEKRQHILLQSYERSWRSRLFRYVQSCGEHPNQALGRLYEASERSDEGGWMGVVLSFVRSDPALLIFGRAQAFVA
ncbi:MAG: J domain-containing protein [Pirellulales bacterium]|nr:J domain-containing protein [Pirellulales bacterium]